MRKIFDGITATATAELDLRGCGGRKLIVMHRIAGGSTGGYCSLKHRDMSVAEAVANKTAKTITTATRTTNVVTVTSTAHGFVAGDIVVISFVRGTTDFNGTFAIASVPTADTFTYAQTADNDNTGAGGKAVTVCQVAHHTGGTNIKSTNQSSDYMAVFADINAVVELTCTVNASNGGKHTVWIAEIDAV